MVLIKLHAYAFARRGDVTCVLSGLRWYGNDDMSIRGVVMLYDILSERACHLSDFYSIKHTDDLLNFTYTSLQYVLLC